MRSAFLMVPLLAASTGFAQTLPQAAPIQPQSQPTIVAADGIHCPVGMKAQQSGVGQTLWTIALEDQSKTQSHTEGGMGVHVDLRAMNGSTIKQVELAVHYLPVGTRFLPLETSSTPDDIKKTFNLSANDGASLKLAGDLLVGHAASILRVDLLSINYTDGTNWHTGKGNYCSAEPSRIVLVNTH